MASNDSWAKALAEAESGLGRDPGLWARCFAEADGDEGKAKAAYVKQRVMETGSTESTATPRREVGYCPSCNYELSMSADACPNCKALFGDDAWKPTSTPQGHPGNNKFTQSSAPVAEKSSGTWKWVVGVPVGLVVAFLGFGAVVGSSPEAKARAADRGAIAYCKQQQEKRSLDATTARLTARVCEEMEAAYKDKWRRNP